MNISVNRPAAKQSPFSKRAGAPRRRLLPVLAAAVVLSFGAAAGHAQAPAARAPLALSHLSPAVASARLLARTNPARTLSLTLVLPLRDRAGLDAQIQRLYNPHDPLYGHFLTPEEFEARYAPSQADIDAVTAFAEAHGLMVDDAAPGGTLVHVSGPASSVETAFGVHLNDYRGADGRTFFAADREPTVSPLIASRLLSVLGLSSNQHPHTFSRRASLSPDLTPLLTYYNGNQGLDPTDIKDIYGLTGTTFTGAGQVAGLFETGTFTASDIQTYFSTYGENIPVTPVSVDGYDTGSAPGGAAGEVTLDIDMFAALAPNLSQIRVYETTDQNTVSFTTLLVDTFTAMSNETAANRPSVISVSYGDTENNYAASDFQALDQATAKLASQGQTVCVSAGDAGAYTDQTVNTPNASFPATDPYILCVGGTDLTDGQDANSHTTYISETSWSDTADTGRGPIGTGGGGGISSYFPLPNYQKNSFTASVNPQGSATKRNVPDVSLYGDYDTGGYDVYFSDPNNGPGWGGYNGTSASSPLWAAFLADVNQARAAKSQGAIGFSNPSIYTAAESSSYSTLFHDVADGSNNLYYNAVKGYDNSTGWGSFIGSNLLTALSASAAPPPYQVRYFPRVGRESRMVGGLFQGSHDNSTWTTLYTVTATPGDAYTAAAITTDPKTFRYLRYLAPNGAYGNVAEIEFDSSGTKITGTGFGTAGSYNNDGLTFGNALDGNTSTYFDAPAPGNGDFVGIDQGGTGANQVRFYPRSSYPSRMVGGQFQGSANNSTWTTLATVTQTPPANAYSTLPTSADPKTFRYLRYLAPNGSYGNVAEIEFDSSGTKLTGTGFGTAGSYNNDGLTFQNALDGNTSTYFDAPAPGNGDFVGIDQGGTGANQVRFYPRSSYPSRMVGGQFQGSANNSTWTTLATVTQTPPANAYSTLPTSADPATFRYLRYLAPNGAYGNVAEIEFDSHGTKLTGTGFGTAGSYNNDGLTFGNALDGNTSTYFDAPAPGNGDYVGIDRGAPAPTITSFSPTSGPVGTSVIINGTNFINNLSGVKFGGVACTTFAANSNTQIQAIVPSGAVTGTVSVTTASGTATSSGSYTVTASAAALSSLVYNPNPAYSSGLSQGTVTLTGPAPAGGASVAITNNGNTLATVVITAGQTSGSYEQPLNAVTTSTSYTLTAVYNSQQVSATLTANPTSVTLSGLSLSPNPVASGGSITGTVTLSAAAPAGGAAVTIYQGTTNLGYVPVLARNTTAQFTLTAPTESSPTTVAYSAAYNGATKGVNETVN